MRQLQQRCLNLHQCTRPSFTGCFLQHLVVDDTLLLSWCSLRVLNPQLFNFIAVATLRPRTFVACCHLAFLHFVYVLPNHFHTLVVRC